MSCDFFKSRYSGCPRSLALGDRGFRPLDFAACAPRGLRVHCKPRFSRSHTRLCPGSHLRPAHPAHIQIRFSGTQGRFVSHHGSGQAGNASNCTPSPPPLHHFGCNSRRRAVGFIAQLLSVRIFVHVVDPYSEEPSMAVPKNCSSEHCVSSEQRLPFVCSGQLAYRSRRKGD